MASEEKSDLDADVTTTGNATAVSLAEPIENVTTSSAVVSDSGATLVTAKSTTIPVTSPVTRRRKMVDNSPTTSKVVVVGDPGRKEAFVAKNSKAADSSLTSTMTTDSPEDNNRSEAMIAVKSESAETVETETIAPPETQNSAPSPRKRQLKITNSDPIPDKRARSSRSEAKDSPASAPSIAEKFQNTHTVSKKLRKKSKEVSESPALTLSPELKGNEETSIAQTSDMTPTENSVLSESKESVDTDTLESPEKENDEAKVKKVRNPYGRRGKPSKHSTTAVNKTKKLKDSKVSPAVPPKIKVDPSEPEAVNPEWLKPFEEGWRREIVFRNAPADTTGGRKCDIYYFGPDNCKLRSTPQIASYLLKQKTDLTSSCFTFVKRLIYMEPGEFVRNAGRRSDITPSTKPTKPQKQKKQKTVPGDSEITPTKPALKLKLKREKFKKPLTKVKIVLPDGVVSDLSIPTLDVDVLKAEPDFHSTPISAETEPLPDSSPSSLDMDGSKWKLMKPKKILSNKESSALPKSTESEQVAVADETCPPPEIPEMPTEALVASSETQLPTVDTSQSETSTPLVTVENKDENFENKDDENMENEGNENTENKGDESVENKDNENVENKNDENVENKNNQNVENKDDKNVENKDNQNVENKDDQSNLKLLPAPAYVAAVKVVDAGHTQTLKKKKSTEKSVAKKNLAKRVKLGPKLERIKVKMLYTEGLPGRTDRQTNIPLGQDLNDVSVTRSNDMSVKPSAGSNTSPTSTAKQTKQPQDRTYYDPLYNPVSDIRRCGLHCAGLYGMAPSLHCDICMCMFHPECVGSMHVPHRKSFTCKACYALNADFSGSNSFSENTVPNSNPILAQSLRTGVNSFDPWTSSSTLPLQLSSSLGAFSSFAIPQVTTTTSGSNGSVGGVQKVSVAGIDRVNPSGHVLSLPLSLASLLNLSRPVTLSISGQKYSIPGSCFMLTADCIKVVLPNNIFTSSSAPKMTVSPSIPLSASQPLFIPDQSSSILPSRNLDALQTTQSEVCPKMCLSERCCGRGGQCEMQSSKEAVQSNDSGERLQGVGQHTHDDPRPSDGETSQLTTETSNGRDVVTDSNEADVGCGVEDDSDTKESCFSGVMSNVELMLHIFKLFNIVDLLKASRVCATWLKISEHLSLWKSVTLSGVKVIDWEMAAQQLTKHQTKSLDLSRLVHCGSENQTWHQLTAAFSSLTTVRDLVFGPCPANLVYFAASKMVELESLKAKEIMDVGGENSANSQTPRLRSTKLDVGKMAVLKNLVHLELRGSHGLILPAFSFTGGLTELTQLTQLKHLSITSLRDVPGKEFHFLSHLENLKLLEIGDCKLWTKEDYEHLGRLTLLKQLKLECVVDSLETGLGVVLMSLSQLEHLELSSFRISKSSADSLSTMCQLKTLHLYSDTCEEAGSSNSYMLTAVKSMKFLTEMTWGILTSDLQTGPSDDGSNAGQNPQPEKLLPFLVETGSGADVGKSSAVDWKSIGELESILKEELASTSVYVVVATQGTDSSS